MSHFIDFNGVRFYRYPDAKDRSSRVYYSPGIADTKRGVKRLHVEIWKAANGPIPRGHHVHHKDDDPLNNALENLECLPGAEHIRHHTLGVCTDRKRENLENIRPLTKVWHASPEGLEWHRVHGHEVYNQLPSRELTCDQCGKTFVHKVLQASYARFCSNACKSAWRRDAGLDDVDRDCAICGATFRVNRYSKKKTCSRICAGKHQSRTKTSRPSAGMSVAAGDP